MFKVVKRAIKLRTGNFEYLLRFDSRSKNIKITIKPDASLIVSQPFLLSEAKTEKFIHAKEKWIQEKIVEIKNRQTILASGLNKLTKKDYLREKKKASDLVLDRLRYFNDFYNFSFAKIYIRNQKTRWGSCSSGKNLSFNFRINYLPPELQDYIIVHELCHLKEANHSSRFWNLVAERAPSYKELRRKLKKEIY